MRLKCETRTPSRPEAADDRPRGVKSQGMSEHSRRETAGNGDGGCCAGVEMRLHDTIPAYTFDSWGNYISQLPFKFACRSLFISLNRKPYPRRCLLLAPSLIFSSHAVVSDSNLKRSGRKGAGITRPFFPYPSVIPSNSSPA